MRKFFKLLSIPAILLLSWRCSTPEEKAVVETVLIPDMPEEKVKDTVVRLRINGMEKEFRFVQAGYMNFQKLQLFLDEYAGRKLVHTEKTMLDLTGDGKAEEIICRAEMKDSAFVQVQILKEGKPVYTDKLTLNEEGAYVWLWESDSVFYQLKPYSIFYDALLQCNIVQDSDSINKNLREFYLSNRSVEAKEMKIDSTEAARRNDSIDTYLKKYKGKLITSLSLIDPDLLFWNESTKTFELLYSP